MGKERHFQYQIVPYHLYNVSPVSGSNTALSVTATQWKIV